MTPQQANELLPCPMCGGTAQIQTEFRSHGYRAIECSECGANVGAVDLERGIEMWNRRAPAPTSEPRARDAVLLTFSDWLNEPESRDESPEVRDYRFKAYRKFQSALATPASPDSEPPTICRPNCFWGDCPPCVDAGITPASPAVPAAPLAPSDDFDMKKIASIQAFASRANPGLDALREKYADPAPLVAQASPWMPIETAPEVKGDYFFCELAWGPEGDQSTGNGLRWNGRWFAAGVFHYLGQERRFAFREHEIKPTHWQPSLAAPEASPLVEDAQRIVAGKVEASDTERLDWLGSSAQSFTGNYTGTVWRAIGSSLWVGSLREAIDGARIEEADRATTGNATADDGKDK